MGFILLGCFRTIYYMLMNIITILVTLFIHRDKSVVLMGAWFGRRFAGNSRYLFQYLSENKSKYHLKRVVWVTRNRQICHELKSMGYEVYMMKSIRGIYYHFKAGVHFANNACYNFNNAKKDLNGDIMGELSLGACKVYLSHAVATSQKESWENGNAGIGYKLAWKIFNAISNIYILKHFILVGGGWDKIINIQTSEEIAYTENVKGGGYTAKRSNYLVTGFPEFCEPLKYTRREREILSLLKQKEKIILYVPAFRTSKKTGYVHPLNNKEVKEFLRKNNFFWIDKMHPAAVSYGYMAAKQYDEDISLNLESDFDMNIIVRHVDMIVSDYSSAVHKAIYYHKPFIAYLVDIEGYKHCDAGLGEEFLENIVGICAYSSAELIKAFEIAFSDRFFKMYDSIYQDKFKYFFGGRKSNYEEIGNKLFYAIYNEK